MCICFHVEGRSQSGSKMEGLFLVLLLCCTSDTTRVGYNDLVISFLFLSEVLYTKSASGNYELRSLWRVELFQMK